MTSTENTKNPQERKAQKVRDKIRELTGTDMPDWAAQAVWDAMRAGIRTTDKQAEEAQGYRLNCCAEYHFARMSGDGASLVPLLYNISFHLAGDSQNFHLPVRHVAKFLDTSEDYVYAAANLLVVSGFWEVIERRDGRATMYRPVGHKEWAEKRGAKYCTVKAEFPFKDETESAKLGAKLFGITGEGNFYDDVLTGWLKLGTSEQLQEWAIEFMKTDADKGKGRKKRLADFFKQKAGKV